MESWAGGESKEEMGHAGDGADHGRRGGQGSGIVGEAATVERRAW